MQDTSKPVMAWAPLGPDKSCTWYYGGPPTLTEAQQLAIAVLEGDADAALVLADEVLLTFHTQGKAHPRRTIIEAAKAVTSRLKDNGMSDHYAIWGSDIPGVSIGDIRNLKRLVEDEP